MPKVTVFNNVSLDGYFTDAKGDMSWAHSNEQDTEWQQFSEENAKQGGMLLFGRVTYEMMAGFWPTPAAAKQMPVVAERMNAMPKVVFSTSLDSANWANTRLVKAGLVEEVKKLKQGSGQDMAIMGSGTIVSQLTEAGLIDVFQVVVHPLVLGAGRTMFEGVSHKVPLKRTNSRTFGNGNVVLTLEPQKS